MRIYVSTLQRDTAPGRASSNPSSTTCYNKPVTKLIRHPLVEATLTISPWSCFLFVGENIKLTDGSNRPSDVSDRNHSFLVLGLLHRFSSLHVLELLIKLSESMGPINALLHMSGVHILHEVASLALGYARPQP